MRFNNFDVVFREGHYPSITCNGQGGANSITIPIGIHHAVMQSFGQIYIPDVSVVVASKRNGVTVFDDVPAWLIWDLTGQNLVIRFKRTNYANNDYFSLTDISQIQFATTKTPISYDLLRQYDV